MNETLHLVLVIIAYTMSYPLSLWYSKYEGEREAYYFYLLSIRLNTNLPDLHPMFFRQRLLMGATMTLVLSGFASYMAIPIGIAVALGFSYIHNGSYFSKRNDISFNTYTKRWKADSYTSSAKNNYTYEQRYKQFITSLIIYVLSLVLFIFLSIKHLL